MKKTYRKRKRDEQSKNKLKELFFLFIISLVIVIAFYKTSKFDFIDLDDKNLIVNNSLITDSTVPYSQCFTRFIGGLHYKPLVFLSWKTEYNLLGSSPIHFHTINWILHLINSIILFFIGLKLFDRIYENRKQALISSLFLTLMFSINPLRIESVAWATERKDVLFAFFFLLAWLVYMFFLDKKNYILIILSAVLYLLSGLSKSMGMTFVFIPFLMDILAIRKIKFKTIAEKLPLFLVLIGLLFLYGLITPDITETVTTNAGVSQPDEIVHKISSLEFINTLPYFLQWIATTSVRFFLWIFHILIPVKLSITYPHDTIFQFFGYSIFIFPLIVILLFVYAWKKKTQLPELIGGLVFFTITMAPALLYTISGKATFLSDRYTYIASVGIFFIVILLLNKFISNKNLLYTFLILITTFYFFQTIKNVNHWKNTETLFTQAIKIHPYSSLSYEALGNYYRDHDVLNKAIIAFSNSIKINKSNTRLYNKRGIIWGKLKKWDEALNDFNIALELNPDYAEALSNRSNVHFNLQEYDKVIEDLEKYLEIKPNDLQIIIKLGFGYYQIKNYISAIQRFNQAIDIDETNNLSYLYRSYSYANLNNKRNALEDALKAKELGAKVSSDYINSLEM